MDQEPKLRSVPPGGSPTARRETPARAEKGPPQNRLQLLLATALAVALVILVWSYVSLGSQIDSLQGEAQVLRAAVAERDELINAQRSRLDEVRTRVQDLLLIMEQPVSAPSAAVPAAAAPEPTPESP